MNGLSGYTSARPVPLISSERHLTALSSVDEKRQIARWRYVFELFALRQLLLDIIEEISRDKRLKEVSRASVIEMRSLFNDMRKRLSRNMGKENVVKFEQRVCDTVDSLDPYLDVCRATLKSEYTQKLCYQDVDASVLVALAGGILRVMQRIYVSLQGKENYELKRVDECLGEIDVKAQFSLLNKGKEPDENAVADSFVALFKELEKRVVVEKRGSEFVWV